MADIRGVSPFPGAALTPPSMGRQRGPRLDVSDLLLALGIGLLGAPGKDWGGGLAGGLQYAQQLGQGRRQEERERRRDELAEGAFGLQEREFGLKEQAAQTEIARRKQLADMILKFSSPTTGGSQIPYERPGMIDPSQGAMIGAMSPDAQEKALIELLVPKEFSISPGQKRMRGSQVIAEGADPVALEAAKYEATLPGRMSVARAGKNQVTLNMPPEEQEYDKAVGKAFGEQFVELTKGERAADVKISRMQTLKSLAGQVETGKWRPAFLQAKKALKTLDIDLDRLGITDDAGPAEALQAISREMALELRNPSGGAGMPGALSDKDREFLESATPGLASDPGSIPILVDYRIRLAKREKEIGALARSYAKENNGRLDAGFNDAAAEWAEQHPLFEGEVAPTQTGTAPAAAARPSADELKRKYGLE